MPLRRLARRLLGRTRARAAAPPPAATRLSPWERYKDYVAIDPTAIIAPSATLQIFTPPEKPRICLEIGAGSHIFSSFALLRPEATIRVGARSQLGASHFVCAERIDVGDDVLMAWGCTVMDNDSHALAWADRESDVATFYEDYRRDPENPLRNKDWSRVGRRPITIGDRTWIGFNVSILKGVTIGAEAVIGAGSVVARDVPPLAVAAGNPAEVTRILSSSAERHDVGD